MEIRFDLHVNMCVSFCIQLLKIVLDIKNKEKPIQGTDCKCISIAEGTTGDIIQEAATTALGVEEKDHILPRCHQKAVSPTAAIRTATIAAESSQEACKDPKSVLLLLQWLKPQHALLESGLFHPGRSQKYHRCPNLYLF